MKQEQKIIKSLIKTPIKNRSDVMRWNRATAKEFGVKIFSNAELIKLLNANAAKKDIERLKPYLTKRAVRTMSGIAPVAVLTKPYPCPGKCAYCPNEKDVPQSYLSNEPAVMRAIRCNYDPYIQVQDRLRALIANGHEPTKIELIVIGGTWSYLPKKYKYWYVVNLFKAANNFKIPNPKSQIPNKFQIPIFKSQIFLKERLLVEQKKNEKAQYKIVGLTLETRPDYIDDKELLEMRELGCTRVEIGVQAIDDDILKLNKRGHGVKEIADATALLRSYGFKITYHLMPGLPGSRPAKDFKMFKQLFFDPRFQPDQIKFYPTVVTKGSLLYKWWRQGKYKPYSDKVLRNLIIKCKSIIPEYVRVIRLIRDIPGESIIAGNMVTNLRQVMKDQGLKCNCIRCREIKDQKLEIGNWKLEIIKYPVSDGNENFLQIISQDRKLLGFCRLFVPDEGKLALVRELHVYGLLTSVGKSGKVQHTGLGKKLLNEAEKIARQNNKQQVKIISGIGVRGYYRKFGYRLNKTYMVKNLIFSFLYGTIY